MPRKKAKSVGRRSGSRRLVRPSIATGSTAGSRKKVSRKVASRGAGDLRLEAAVSLGDIWSRIPRPQPIEFRLHARRPDDLLVFDLLVENLELAPEGPPRLIRSKPGKPAALVIELPPQHFGEQAFLDTTGADAGKTSAAGDAYDPPFPESASDTDPKNVPTGNAQPIGALPAANMRIAGASRLAFAMPPEVSELELSYTAVLDACRDWPLRLSVLAQKDPPERVLSIDKEWLLQVTESAAWQVAVDLLTRSVETLASRAAVTAAADAARRLGQHMLADRTGGTAAAARNRLNSALDAELNALQQRFSTLRSAEARELLTAGLAVLAIRDYARTTPDHSLEAVARQPLLPIILRPHEPPGNVTALELPYRLITTPVLPALWRHASEAVTHGGRTELWHTRLSANRDTALDTPTRIRAIWSPDYEFSREDLVHLVNDVKPFRMSLDPLDRKMLVQLMAGYNERYNQRFAYRPRSSGADRLHLSALGALLDSEGSWNPAVNPDGVDLEQWRHVASLGRDQYVRVVYRGFLFPFGHSASLIKVTERKFENHDGLQKRVAVLRQRFFIVVREPLREFSGAGHAFSGRNFPFRRVQILTRVTPTLRAPEDSKINLNGSDLYKSIAARECFWPSLSGGPFGFELRLTDICGQQSTFNMPLLFVGQEANTDLADEIRDLYNDNHDADRRGGDLGGQSVCYAPLPDSPDVSEEENKGDPRLPTHRLAFRAEPIANPGFRRPKVYPAVDTARVGVRAVQRMLNKPDALFEVRYADRYKTEAFGGANTGEVFLQAAGNPLDLDFENDVKSDSLGAIGSPQMQIAGLSRKLGPAADLDKVSDEQFDPAAFFDGAKLLGGISVKDLIGVVSALPLGDAPKMLSQELSDRIEASFTWDTVITDSDPLGLFVPSAGGTTTLAMSGTSVSPIDNPGAATFAATATLVNFKVNLFDFITIWFDRLRFESTTGTKPEVLVDLHPGDDTVVFGGPLEFVNKLREVIPMDGFSDPPNLTVTPSGLTASYSLALPAIGVGVFSLTNVSLGAGFSLPFDSRPVTVRFNFSERQSPFSLTVSMFGGGGFFAIGVGAEGVQEIEAALEFGAGVAINLGVASGSVEVKAGVYFHWLTDLVELSGYVRLHGELSVIGLISASLTFHLQLSYLKQGTKSTVWGEASLVVEIEVLVFSGSVTVHCRREFGGSESDPTFLDIIPDKPTWASYCEAFALEEAA